MDPTTWWYVLAGLLIVLGLLGTILPMLPGTPLVFAGMLLAAWAGDFQLIGVWTLVILGVLVLLTVAIDLLASALGAKQAKASPKAVWGALLGTLLGLFFGIPGLLIGPFVGAVAGELIHRRSMDQDQLGEATRIGIATWVGMVVGIALKLAVAFAMLGIFALALLI